MFRRVLVIAEIPEGAGRAIETARRLATHPERVHLVGLSPVSPFLKFQNDPWDDLLDVLNRADAQLARLRAELTVWCADVTSEPALELRDEDLRASAKGCGADVIVVGPIASRLPTDLVDMVALTVQSVRIPVVVATAGDEGDDAPIRRLLFPFDGKPQSAAAFAGFARERTGPDHELGFFALRPVKALAPEDIDANARVAGLSCTVRFAQSDAKLLELRAAIPSRIAEWRSQMLCVLLDAEWGVTHWLGGVFVVWALRELRIPVALVPTETHGLSLYLDPETLCAADVFVGESPLTLYVERVNVLGMPQPLNQTHVAIIDRGELRAVAYAHNGYLTIREDEFSIARSADFLGLGRVSDGRWRDPVASLETKAAIVRPARPVLLVDAEFRAESLARLHTLHENESGIDIFGVKLALNTRLDEAKERFLAAGFASPRVFEAGQILGSGRLSDVPGGFEAVLLARAAARLRSRGVDVVAIAHGSAQGVDARGFATFTSADLDALEPEALSARIFEARTAVNPEDASIGQRLDATTASRRIGGNRVGIVLDNAEARRTLVALIDEAHERLHIQTYIVHDEESSREIAAALVRAAQRGVKVRFLVDALYSLHETMGIKNPFMERLAPVAGIEVAANRPIEGMPSINDLKRRDHRKLVIVDGCRAIVTGRNLADTYYRGFDEIALTHETPGAQIPWFDAGACVEGPIVEQVETSFLGAWVAAGREPFDVVAPPPVGSVAARFVVHRGLRDAYTLEAYLALIDAATRDLLVVNTFPMQFEILRALRNAVGRGVRVRVLVGHVRPMWSDRDAEGVYFPGGAIRELATQVVHGRIDELVEAGAEAYEYVAPPGPAWGCDLGAVRAHVHAKMICADGRWCAIGSANLDITAGYWESEALLVVEDAAFATDVEARFESILAASIPIDRDDPRWRERAEERAWLSKNWPSLLG
ncbi:MAG: phosphatidylserine/phosphatidylglycerophosphate/cardiolipin synthase family protein [Deltaproteobacteria bacterium]|nr:phosphatidylserine/phosphatidylglycerophosphate/cardiolipin synthase family protein [Deltaproteobacteria bacterium]